MTTYSRAAYGANPNAARNPNNDYGWGNHHWPAGVPASLLGTLRFPGKLGTVIIVARKELLPLIGTLMALSEASGYYFHPGWCWSYSNRPVTGSTTMASNHSRGKAVDLNAPSNPFSWTFKSDIPPAVVRLWETHGFYWGGRYTGQPTDAMHMEYVYTPADVARHYQSAAALLAAQEDDMTPQDKKDIINGVVAALKPVIKAEAKAAVTEAWAEKRFTLTDSRFRPPRTIPDRTFDQVVDTFSTWVSSAEGGATMVGRILGYDPEDRDEFEAAAKAGKTKENRK